MASSEIFHSQQIKRTYLRSPTCSPPRLSKLTAFGTPFSSFLPFRRRYNTSHPALNTNPPVFFPSSRNASFHLPFSRCPAVHCIAWAQPGNTCSIDMVESPKYWRRFIEDTYPVSLITSATYDDKLIIIFNKVNLLLNALASTLPGMVTTGHGIFRW